MSFDPNFHRISLSELKVKFFCIKALTGVNFRLFSHSLI